jgi:hypothetical protein
VHAVRANVVEVLQRMMQKSQGMRAAAVMDLQEKTQDFVRARVEETRVIRHLWLDVWSSWCVAAIEGREAVHEDDIPLR